MASSTLFIYPLSNRLAFVISHSFVGGESQIFYELRRYINTWNGFSLKKSELMLRFIETKHLFDCLCNEVYINIKTSTLKFYLNRKKSSLRIIKRDKVQKMSLIIDEQTINRLKQERVFLIKMINIMSNTQSFNDGMKIALVIDEIKIRATNMRLNGSTSTYRTIIDGLKEICYYNEKPFEFNHLILEYFPSVNFPSNEEIEFVIHKHEKDFLSVNGIKNRYKAFFDIIEKLTDI